VQLTLLCTFPSQRPPLFKLASNKPIEMKLTLLIILAIAVGRGATAGSLRTSSGEDRDLASSAATTCANRCKKNCKVNPNPEKCADSFITGHCSKFAAKVRATVKASCLAGSRSGCGGVTTCTAGAKCVLPGQCCADSDCAAGQRCLGNLCTAKGNPSITLLWTGIGQ
jgi:hypothetical protein